MRHTKILKMPELSVIIPTHKRAEILEQCLHHLESQTIADKIEAIVIHDGQDDKTDALMAKSTWQIPVHYESIPKSQQGVARNRGVQNAQSSTCLFIGDDIFLEPEVCAHHESIHRNIGTPIAVLGGTYWDPHLEITEVMEWLMRSGWQFGYPKIESYAGDFLPKHIQHLFCYTSHLSVSTEVAKRTPFREDVSLYGWEDIEWGMRLRESGVQVYYEPQAKAFHHHIITMEDSLKRMETIGESAVVLSRVVPEFDRIPRGWKRIAYEIFAKFPTMAGKHRAAFLKGINKGVSS
ncbi:hypothetical protein CL635_02315 [bacterium]|nr:hypothetical protein [bacterium]|tara:strand:- start:485 stop:1363 length:879 start_codon:yes stop_codon:yes gene_type:complete